MESEGCECVCRRRKDVWICILSRKHHVLQCSKNILLAAMLAFFSSQKRKTGFRKTGKKKGKMVQNEKTLAKIKDVVIVNEWT